MQMSKYHMQATIGASNDAMLPHLYHYLTPYMGSHGALCIILVFVL
jgi:hypothetical protein